MQTGDQALVKELNKAIILNSIRTHGPTSRAWLAKQVGLNKTTVSALVAELINQQFVLELGIGKATQSGGRKPYLLEFNGNAGLVIGVELGVTYILTVVINLAGEVLASRRVDIHPRQGQDFIIEKLISEIRQIHDNEFETAHGLLGIGVGVPGLVDKERRHILFAPNLKWHNVPLREILSQHFTVPVYLENEANVGAIGEYLFGAGKNVTNLGYFSVGVGIGVGILLNGDVYRGSFGIAGEFGHTTLDVNGPECSCGGKGCLEAFASESALLREVFELSPDSGRYGFPVGKRHEALEPGEIEGITRNVADAAESGDAQARELLSKCGRYLGIGIANFIKTFDPEMVIVGSHLPANAWPWLLATARREIGASVFGTVSPSAKIVASELGANARVIGAASLVLKDILKIPRLRTRTSSSG